MAKNGARQGQFIIAILFRLTWIMLLQEIRWKFFDIFLSLKKNGISTQIPHNPNKKIFLWNRTYLLNTHVLWEKYLRNIVRVNEMGEEGEVKGDR